MPPIKNALPGLVSLLLIFFRLVPASGGTDFETIRLKSAADNPPGVSLSVRLPEGKTQFHRGEVIPLASVFTSSLPDKYQLNSDPGNRDLLWNQDTFQVDSLTGVVDPLRVYYDREFGESYSGPGPRFEPLAAQPLTISYTLNEWLRFDTPGRYRIYLTSRRVVVASKRHQDLLFQGRATVSNAVDIEILPDDPAWDAKTLAQALPLFNANGSDARTQQAQQAATRTIRFLGTPDAARAMVAQYGRLTEDDSWNSLAYYQTRLGLFGFPDPAFIIQEMKRNLADPNFPICSFFLYDLAQTQFLAAYSQPIPPFVPNNPGRDKERQAALHLRMAPLTALTDQDRKDLAAVIPAKQGKARAASLYTLLMADYADRDKVAHRKLARALVPVFFDLNVEEQSNLLDEWNWEQIRGPDMLPILRRLYASSSSGAEAGSSQYFGEQQSDSLVLRRLMEMSPAEGRAILLAEIRSDHPRVDLPTLCSLPDRALPALDTVLAANLEHCLQTDGDNWENAPRLVERNGTQAILPRVKAAYGDKGGKWACDIQSNLLAYFLRTDHAYGLKQVKKALASRRETACYHSVLSDVAGLAAGPDIERLAVTHLHDPDSEVVADAAKTLGAYGGRVAEGPLWARMKEWHQQWAGKGEQIEPTDQHIAPMPGQIEYELINALANAPGWLLTPSKLKALQSLCVTQNAQGNVTSYLQEWSAPILISYSGEGDEWTVVQYRQLTSLAALENKLAQFPRGTRFRLSAVNFPDAKHQAFAYRRLNSFLRKRGMQIGEEARLFQ